MKKEKKLNAKQKLALERIYRLFELASEMQEGKIEDKEKYVKRYLELAKRIGEKVNISVPKEMQKKYCKKCFSMNVSGKNDSEFFIVKCKDCEFERKFSPTE